MNIRMNRTVLLPICLLVAFASLSQTPELIPYRKGNKWGFANGDKQVLIPAEYDTVAFFSEGMAAVLKGGKWGYVDQTGKYLPMYVDYAEAFRDGQAKVWQKKGDMMMGVIDKTRKLIIPLEYTSISDLKNGIRLVKSAKNRYGILDTEGKIVVPLEYDEISPLGQEPARVRKGGKAGFMDSAGKLVVPIIYNNAFTYFGGLVPVMQYGSYGDEWWLIDRQGNKVGSEKFSKLSTFSRGYTWGKQKNEIVLVDSTGKIVLRNPPVPAEKDPSMLGVNNGRTMYLFFENSKAIYGVIDIQGNSLLPPDYRSVSLWSPNFILAQKDGIWQLFDNKGKPDPKLKFEGYYSLQSSRVLGIRIGKNFGLLGTNGKIILQPIYDTIGRFNKGLAIISKNGLYGYINDQGKEIIKPKYSNAFAFNDEGLAPVWKDGKAGFIDTKGKEIIAPKYDAVNPDDMVQMGTINYVFRKGVTCVRLNGKWGYIDMKGVEYWED